MNIVTTATGYFKPGLTGTARYTGTRRVYLGPLGKETPHDIAEFDVTLQGEGRDGIPPRPNCQLGRDFEIVSA